MSQNQAKTIVGSKPNQPRLQITALNTYPFLANKICHTRYKRCVKKSEQKYACTLPTTCCSERHYLCSFFLWFTVFWLKVFTAS